MKILITGANGLLGHELSSILKEHTLILLSHEQLDISNSELVDKYITSNSPDYVINSAAYTQVDACETNYDLAYSSNALGPRNLAITFFSLFLTSGKIFFSWDFSRPILQKEFSTL